MVKPKWTDHIRDFIGGLAFRLFLWVHNKTAQEYWTEIWEQEEAFRSVVSANTNQNKT